MGCIYRRRKTLLDGSKVEVGPYWIKYYQDGRPKQEPTHSFKESDARRLLKLREGAVAKGLPLNLRADKITVGELLDDLLLDYRVNHQRSYKDFAEPIVRVQLQPAFQHLRAARLTTSMIQGYRDRRLEDEAAPATINREMALLKRAFNLGRRHTPPKVFEVPYIPMFTEDNVRTGFFEHEEFLALRAALEEPLCPVVTFAYYTGCRRGEILSLRWVQVELDHRVVILEPGTTKNKQGRILPLRGELYEVITMLKAIRDQRCPECPWVFFRARDGRGEPIREFRGAWEKVCKAAGLVDAQGEVNRLFHDLRRTGVRNLIRAGVPERVAMRISGHKTRSVFDRYNIVDERDLHDAARRLDDYLAAKETKPSDGYISVTPEPQNTEVGKGLRSKLLN